MMLWCYDFGACGLWRGPKESYEKLHQVDVGIQTDASFVAVHHELRTELTFAAPRA